MVTDRTDEPNHEPRAKIFISYSRKDMAFTDRLDEALRARGYRPLVDRGEIYAFEDWWKRIQTLIGSADTVVYVLSPDAVASRETLKEIEYAASLNKRFAPIVCRPVEAAAVPEQLRKLNFVFFDDPSRFEANADQLAEALATDIGWIRQHTSFGEAAKRWADAGRPGPRGLLLRSPTLEDAERWIASRPRGAPEPTETLRAFLAESRRAATARRSLLTAGLGAGLLVALVLAGIAFWQRGIAVSAQQVASEQRETALSAQSRTLAAEAERMLGEGDTQNAILLSLEALRRPGDVGPERHSAEAEKPLLDALYRNPLRAILRADNDNKYVDAAFVSGSTVLAAIRADGSTAFWNIDDGGRLAGPARATAPIGHVKAVFANPARPIWFFAAGTTATSRGISRRSEHCRASPEAVTRTMHSSNSIPPGRG